MGNEKEEIREIDKLAVLLGYWVEHNREHIAENVEWMEKAERAGFRDVARRLEKAIELSKEVNHQMEHALEDLERRSGSVSPRGSRGAAQGEGHAHERPHAHGRPARGPAHSHRHVELHQIGTISTPFREEVPKELPPEGDFSLHVDDRYREGLFQLERFSHVYVIFHLDRSKGPAPLIVTPRGGRGIRVGVFASRSPERPNPIGQSIVRVLGVEGGTIRISPIDVFDRTPLLDIKPYFGSRDALGDAGNGWAEDLPPEKG